jgi:hypothetical protein
VSNHWASGRAVRHWPSSICHGAHMTPLRASLDAQRRRQNPARPFAWRPAPFGEQPARSGRFRVLAVLAVGTGRTFKFRASGARRRVSGSGRGYVASMSLSGPAKTPRFRVVSSAAAQTRYGQNPSSLTGFDVLRMLQTTALDAVFGREGGLQGLPRNSRVPHQSTHSS